MKSFSSYYFVFKLMFWASLIMAAFSLIMNIFLRMPVQLPVRPYSNNEQMVKAVASFPGVEIGLLGRLEINQPTFYQTLLNPGSSYFIGVVESLFWIISSIVLLRIIKSIEKSPVFKTDIARMLRIIGLALILYHLMVITRTALLMNEIQRLTSGQFTPFDNTKWPVEFSLGLLLIWVSRIYKKAILLQQEQDLTI